MTRKADPREIQLPVPAGQLPTFTPVPRQTSRHDGWTEARQHAFIEALADTGSVHAACKAVNMSQAGAYHLRRQAGAESFRKAWEAALSLGVQRIEDVAMDRALNGVDVPVYSYGKLVGSRKHYNDRLLMFMLRNRAPDRFAAGGAKGLNAIGKMDAKRLKKQWRKEWEAEQPKRKTKKEAKARKLIEEKLEDLRQRVLARREAEWEKLSDETKAAHAEYERLRERDLGALGYWQARERRTASELRSEAELPKAGQRRPRARAYARIAKRTDVSAGA